MPRGTIKRWAAHKGFGFLASEGKEIFAHASQFVSRSAAPEYGPPIGSEWDFEFGEMDGRPAAKTIRMVLKP